MNQNLNQRPPNDGLLAVYSHTSRVWNSAVTLTLAAIAISAGAMLSDGFLKLCLPYRIILGIIFYLGVVFGFFRIVELGCELQFLESEIRIDNRTLLEYTEDIPRIRWLRRLNQEQAQQLRGSNIRTSWFGWQHWVALAAWNIMFLVIFIAP